MPDDRSSAVRLCMTMMDEREASVLVVDDEPQVVWVLQFSLEAEGYRTLAATDGLEALEQIDEHHPKVMLLDIMMPEMDGWAVLERLVAIPREQRPKVVVVSALSSVRDRAKAAELGADAFVPKPFNVDELLEVLQGIEPAPVAELPDQLETG